MKSLLFAVCSSLLAVLAPVPTPAIAGPAEIQFLQALEGRWSGQGRAATTQGEAPVSCEVEGRLRNGVRMAFRADCRTQGQSGTISMSLYFSDMSRQFHGELSSPVNYISGSLNGHLSRGDLFLRLAASDGSEGRLLLVASGDQGMRLLVTTIVDGASITVFDLPLTRVS